MSDVAIHAEGLGKLYRIGAQQEKYFKYHSLRETLTQTVTRPVRKLSSLFGHNGSGATAAGSPILWALKDVSFEIKRGEVVGIIGRNGAGKSTLLKILSRITEPTEGRAEIHGRVGSLLEVGTGFHPELTGRENIYLNAAILGMKKVEIERKFDEIVAFAEIDKFIDTPVKRYSSGMYVRLAFAVAAHLEPEILLVDEVLAVGDARFQKKCLHKMEDVGQQGRTVLFVSHNMPAISRLCERTILLDSGRLLHDGPSKTVVAAYLDSGTGTTAVREWLDPAAAPHAEIARLRAVRTRTQDGVISAALDIRQPIGIDIDFEVLTPGYRLMPSIHVHNDTGIHVFSAVEHDPVWRGHARPTGRYVATAWIPGNFLSEGALFVDVGLTTLDPLILQFFERHAVAFQVVDSLAGETARGDWGGHFPGAVRPLLHWTTQFAPPSAIPTHPEATREEGTGR